MIPRIVKILYENIKNTNNNQVFILILYTGLTNSIVHDTNSNSSVYSGIIARKDNEIMRMTVTTGLAPEIYSSSDGGQTFTGGAFIPVKAHFSVSSTTPPHTSLGAFQYFDWILDFTPNISTGYSMWDVYDITVPFAGAYKLVPINIFPNSEGKLVITVYNPSNNTVNNIDLLIVNVTEYWVKDVNY